MKTNFRLVLATALCAVLINAQVSVPLASTVPIVVETGPHHRVWQSVNVGWNELGRQIAITNSYTELGTGMNVWSEKDGKWVPASDEIQLVNGAAAAAGTQHKVIFLPNLNDPNPPIDLFLPDGRNLPSQIIGLAYTETDTGKSVFIS